MPSKAILAQRLLHLLLGVDSLGIIERLGLCLLLGLLLLLVCARSPARVRRFSVQSSHCIHNANAIDVCIAATAMAAPLTRRLALE